MAKRKQDKSPETPVTVETATEEPLETSGGAGDEPAGLLERVSALEAQVAHLREEIVKLSEDRGRNSAINTGSVYEEPTEESYIVSDTGEFRTVRTRQGYAPAPIPVGWRIATEAEIVKYKGR